MPDKKESSDHLIELPNGWKLWKTIALRGAGFPVDLLEAIAEPEAAAAVDQMLDLEEESERRRREAEDFAEKGRIANPKPMRPTWRRATRLLKKGRVPEPIEGATEYNDCLPGFADSIERLESAREQAVEEIDSSEKRTWKNLQGICENPLFREALIWQNRKFFLRGVASAFEHDWNSAKQSSRRNRAHKIAFYLQRYAAKNDTIGFFGPVGWARFSEEGPPVAVEPGESLVSRRVLYPEYWGIHALSDALTRNPDIRQWLPIRPNPLWRFFDDYCVGPKGKKLPTPPKILEMIRSSDGETPAMLLADNLVADPDSRFSKVDEVFPVLARLAEAGMVRWNADVPVDTDEFESYDKLLNRIGDESIRQRAQAPVEEIRTAQRKVGEASGDPDALNEALGRLEKKFENITGKKSTHLEGLTYAGRTLVYQDCERDVDVSFGSDTLSALERPLSLILRSSSWFADVLADRLTEFLNSQFDEQVRTVDTDSIPFVLPVLLNRNVPLAIERFATETEDELRRRWKEILSHEPDARSVRWTGEELEPLVQEVFPETLPGWPSARFHSPDLMIAAEGLEAINAGDYEFVLGELHCASNTIVQRIFAQMHPDPETLAREFAADLKHPQVLTVISSSHLATRVAPSSISFNDFEVAIDGSPSWRDSDHVIHGSELMMRRTNHGLEVVTRDGDHRFQLPQFYRHLLQYHANRSFSIISEKGHLPRMSIDKLVIQRERWSLAGDDIPFSHPKTATDRFIAARRWKREMGMPRRMFFKVATETKPVYLDLDSPLFVDAASKMIRQSMEEEPESPVVFSEMLPTPEQCWLIDHEGNRYTSELRVAGINPQPWEPSGVPT